MVLVLQIPDKLRTIVNFLVFALAKVHCEEAADYDLITPDDYLTQSVGLLNLSSALAQIVWHTHVSGTK